MMEPMLTLRVARPTDNLRALVLFYAEGLGFDVLACFERHAGFDGVILGRAGSPYHFEFTRYAGHRAGRAPSQDHLLVFYHSDRAAWQQAVDRLRSCGFDPVPSFDPYWDQAGCTFEDPDGYRVVLQNGAWTP